LGRNAIDAAEGLGIHQNILYRWIRQYKEDPKNAFPGNGNLKPEEEELRRLKK